MQESRLIPPGIKRHFMALISRAEIMSDMQETEFLLYDLWLNIFI